MNNKPQPLLALATEQPHKNAISDFLKQGFVKVSHALTSDSAELLYAHIQQQVDWNLVFNHNGQHQDLNARAVDGWTTKQKEDLNTIVNEQACKGFQYLYENIPVYCQGTFLTK